MDSGSPERERMCRPEYQRKSPRKRARRTPSGGDNSLWGIGCEWSGHLGTASHPGRAGAWLPPSHNSTKSGLRKTSKRLRSGKHFWALGPQCQGAGNRGGHSWHAPPGCVPLCSEWYLSASRRPHSAPSPQPVGHQPTLPSPRCASHTAFPPSVTPP